MLLKYKHNEDTLNNAIYSDGLPIIHMQTVCSFITSLTSAAKLVSGGL